MLPQEIQTEKGGSVVIKQDSTEERKQEVAVETETEEDDDK